MIKMKLLNDNSEIISYNFTNFPISSREYSLSEFPNMSAINHWHDDLEFTIITKGKMSYSINGKSYEIKAGEGIFVNSGQMHYGYSSDGSDCTFICILLNLSLISNIDYIKDSYLSPICTDESHPFFIFNSSVVWQNNFIELLNKLYEVTATKQEGFELHVMSIFYSIIHFLYSNVKNDNVSKETYHNKNLDILHDMVGYIQKNYNNKITLKEIASAGNICRSTCCEIFQSILNKSPISYLTEYRLDKSIKMLNIPSYSITEIALKSGFNSSSYFTETFHKNIGCTPSQYRKKHINTL